MADYTYDQVMQALRNADAKGDTAAAKRLAVIAKGMKAPPPVTDVMVPPAAPADAGPGWLPPSTPKEPNVFGDTTRDLVAGPIEATKAYASGLMDQSKSPTMQALPDWVPAKRMVAGVGDAGGTALSALGAGLAFGTGVGSEIVGGDTDNEKRLARDMMGMQQVAVPELAGVSSLTRAAPAAVRGAERSEFANAAARQNVTPSLAMTSKVGATTAAGLEKVPLTGGVIANDAARAAGEIESAAARITSNIGRAESPYMAGDILQGGLNKFVKRVKAKAGEMFGEVGRLIPAGTVVPTTNSQKLIAEINAKFAQNPKLAESLGLTRWNRVMAEAEKNGMNWEVLKEFRSSVGEAVEKANTGAGPLGNANTAQLKRLYGALTEDMQTAAKAAGPEAFKAWTRANNYYSASAKRIERQLDSTISAKSPERAFEAFVSATRADRSTADFRRIRAIKASVEPEEWNDIAASIVDRLGKAKPGVSGPEAGSFSPSTFLTQYNSMAPEAKRLLLTEDVRNELDDLSRIAERARAAGMERNHSNTGTAAGWLATIFTAPSHPGTAATAIGGSYLTAKALTSPMFLRAMNAAARGDSRAVRAMAAGQGPFARDATEILRLMAADAAGGDAANTNAPTNRAVNY